MVDCIHAQAALQQVAHELLRLVLQHTAVQQCVAVLISAAQVKPVLFVQQLHYCQAAALHCSEQRELATAIAQLQESCTSCQQQSALVYLT
eukprot:761-Heterococcus_DN1.PRE.3